CSSARSNQLLHTKFALAPVWNVSFPRDGRSTSAPPTRMRLFPVRRPLNRNRRHSRLESWGRDQQRARTTLISEPERRRAGDTLSSGLGRRASEKLRSRALPLRGTPWLMYLVTGRGCPPRRGQ